MRPISLHVDDEVYHDLKSVAERTGRPVAELIREAMSEYLVRRVGQGGSIFDLPPHESGALLRGWTRADLLDEMLGS
jgi:hypothetical protein